MKIILAILGLTCILGFTHNSVTPSSATENEMLNAYVATDTGQMPDVLHEYTAAVSPPDLVAETTVFYLDRTDSGRLAKNSRTPVSIDKLITYSSDIYGTGEHAISTYGQIDTGITDGNKPHYTGIVAMTDTTTGAIYADHPAAA